VSTRRGSRDGEVALKLSNIFGGMSKPRAADKLRRGLVPKSVAVFIDGLNVRFRLKECGWQELYDVGHLAESLCGRRKLVGIFFYHPPPNREQLGASRYGVERAYLERIRKDIGVVIPRGSYMAKRAQTRQGLTCDVLGGEANGRPAGLRSRLLCSEGHDGRGRSRER
jgi:hypothetical protein